MPAGESPPAGWVYPGCNKWYLRPSWQPEFIQHQSVLCIPLVLIGMHSQVGSNHECLVQHRAGDTIVLEAGQSHDARDVVIPWPLKLMGSGIDAEETLILCPKGPDAALDFRCCLMDASGCTMHTL